MHADRIAKPFGPFENFEACLAQMTAPKDEGGSGYDEETARRVCGRMKSDMEKSYGGLRMLNALRAAHKAERCDCGEKLVYDDSRDAYVCPRCGTAGPNGPAKTEG